MDKRLVRVAGVIGLLCPALVLICIGFSIYISPWFSWTDNCLSDLGESNAAAIFNNGLIVGGVMGMVFAIGLYKSGFFKSKLGHLGLIFFFLGVIALFAIGTFPITTGSLHAYAAFAFFICAPLSMLMGGVSIFGSGNRVLGSSVITLSIIAFLPLFIHRLWMYCAIAEMVIIIPVAIFVILFGYKLFKDVKTSIPDKPRRTAGRSRKVWRA